MDTANLRIRLSFSAREVEISGRPEDVEQWYDRLSDRVEQFASNLSRQAGSPTKPGTSSASAVAGVGETQDPGSLPQAFGEFYHRFRPDITDVDRMLVAAFFVEQRSEARAFTTGDSNQLLRDQGVRVTNPSEAVRRNLAARRIFKMSGREFRIAKPAGIEHLRSLLTVGSALD